VSSLRSEAAGLRHAVRAPAEAGVETTVPAALLCLFERAENEGRAGEGSAP
jgi:F420-0:gamma-glutamyl ligase-like protein